MKSNSVLVKTMIIIAFLTGIAGLAMSFTPLKMMALIPSVLGVVISIAAYAIAKSKEGKMIFIYTALIISSLGTITALVREFSMEDQVVVDEQFEVKKDSSIQEGNNDPDLESNLDELE